jgi:peptidoglycan hydrolase-like protein with peptidoglycan-binding domain
MRLCNAAEAIALRLGDSGAEVYYPQKLLRGSGYLSSSSITGFYGSITTGAVSSFQGTNGLCVDGIASNSTFTALKRRGGYSPVRSRSNALSLVNNATEGYSPVRLGSDVLYLGSNGAEIVHLQNLLHRAGYFYGASTGYYGSITTDAVCGFQPGFG